MHANTFFGCKKKKRFIINRYRLFFLFFGTKIMNLYLATLFFFSSLVFSVDTMALNLNVPVISHTQSLELEPIANLDYAVKVANVCPLQWDNCRQLEVDYEGDVDLEQMCRDEDYTLTSCGKDANNSNLIPDETCPYSSTFFKNCICNTTLYPELDNCPLNSSIILQCSDNLGTHLKCGCDSTLYIECNGDNQYIDSVYDGDTSVRCNGNIRSDLCITCEKGQVPNTDRTACICLPEYSSDCNNGTYDNSDYCLLNGVKKYKESNCKPCPNLGIYDECPEGLNCIFETCSNKWYASGCAIDYYDIELAENAWISCFAGDGSKCPVENQLNLETCSWLSCFMSGG